MPADYETPGLVGLEAGLARANVVITERGSTKDYYGKYVWYVNPDNIKDIRTKLLQAYKAEKNDNLRNHIKKNFLWDKIAKKTLEGYKKVL